jgi:hypothetical protein
MNGITEKAYVSFGLWAVGSQDGFEADPLAPAALLRLIF